MISRTRLFALSAMLVALASCSTLSKKQCMQGDWYGIGVADGTEGRRMSRLQEHEKACHDHGVQSDGPAYRKGWNQGIRTYCRIENAFTLGRSGDVYQGVCPASLEAKFLPRYRAGFALFEMDATLKRLDSKIVDLESSLDRDVSDSERRRIREELQSVRRERDLTLQQMTVLELRQNQ